MEKQKKPKTFKLNIGFNNHFLDLLFCYGFTLQEIRRFWKAYERYVLEINPKTK